MARSSSAGEAMAEKSAIWAPMALFILFRFPPVHVFVQARLFRVPVASRAVLPTAFGFDVSADGSRFLLPTVREPLSWYLVVVQGWESFLKRKRTGETDERRYRSMMRDVWWSATSSITRTSG